MFKKLLSKIWSRIWRRQDKKLNDLQKKVNSLESKMAVLEKKIDEQKKQNQDLKNYIKKEMDRRDDWEIRSAELRYLAKGKKIWVIKSPAPDSADKVKWAEYQFYLNFKKELENQGYYVYIDYAENWKGSIDADFVLVSLANKKYHPDRRVKNCKYILWLNCYPDKIELEDYELYDCVLVSSNAYAEKLSKELTVPVYSFLLCTDVKQFYPAESTLLYDKMFVGNTRGVIRDCILWCEEKDIKVHLWGRKEGKVGWENFVKKDSSIILEGFLPNEELPEVLRASKIVLNDHFVDMRREGFMNLRTIEALLCGCVILSDYHHELEKLFEDAIIYYRGKEDFYEKLSWLEEHFEEQREKVKKIIPEVREHFSMESRVKELIEISKGL